MKKQTSFILSAWTCLCLVIALGCGGKKSTEIDNSQAFDSVKLSLFSGQTAVGVTHRVKDYEQWLAVYEQNSDPDARISVYASPDDANLVTVFQLTRSHEAARKDFDSEELKTAMNTAGVTSEPVVTYYDIKFRSEAPSEKIYRIKVMHPVTNYDQWKKIFDEDEKIRTEAGLELRAISTSAEDPSIVHIMFATDNVDKAKDLINSDDLKKRMAEAGVKSQPELTVYKVPGKK